MGFLDILLCIFLVYGFIRGIWNGFFVELASFVSLIIGIYVAIKFSHLMKNSIAGHVSWTPKTIQITAFILTFIVVVVGIIFLAKFLTTVANFASLGLVNKLIGGFFGLLKMVLILSVILNFFMKINSNNTFAEKQTLEKSLFFYPIQKIAATIYPSIEDWFSDLKNLKSMP